MRLLVLLAVTLLQIFPGKSHAAPKAVETPLMPPEEAVAYLFFGEGYKNPCVTAYQSQSCPLKIATREIRVNDGTYDHLYRLSKDYCTVEFELVALKDNHLYKGSVSVGNVRAVTAKYSSYLGRSVEFVFVFTGNNINNTLGESRDEYFMYHEYYAFSGKNFQDIANLELLKMRDILKSYQQRYCDRQA